MSANKKWLSVWLISATAIADWNANFQPYEREGNENIMEAVNSMSWLIYAVAGLTSLSLFILAGNKCREGDYLAGGCSIFGACVVAMAPIMASNYFTSF